MDDLSKFRLLKRIYNQMQNKFKSESFPKQETNDSCYEIRNCEFCMIEFGVETCVLPNSINYLIFRHSLREQPAWIIIQRIIHEDYIKYINKDEIKEITESILNTPNQRVTVSKVLSMPINEIPQNGVIDLSNYIRFSENQKLFRKQSEDHELAKINLAIYQKRGQIHKRLNNEETIFTQPDSWSTILRKLQAESSYHSFKEEDKLKISGLSALVSQQIRKTLPITFNSIEVAKFEAVAYTQYNPFKYGDILEKSSKLVINHYCMDLFILSLVAFGITPNMTEALNKNNCLADFEFSLITNERLQHNGLRFIINESEDLISTALKLCVSTHNSDNLHCWLKRNEQVESPCVLEILPGISKNHFTNEFRLKSLFRFGERFFTFYNGNTHLKRETKWLIQIYDGIERRGPIIDWFITISENWKHVQKLNERQVNNQNNDQNDQDFDYETESDEQSLSTLNILDD